MARLMDLEEAEEAEPAPLGGESQQQKQDNDEEDETEHEIQRPNLNIDRPFSRALGCYPIISLLAPLLDLTTLHELSRTCRQVRANLLQYRKLLIASSLRCRNETATPGQRLGSALSASHQAWNAYGAGGRVVMAGKLGACARDLVGGCRRCGGWVCRNCVIKAPPTSTLKGRHRRLCRTCMKAPLQFLTAVTRVVNDETGETRTIARSPCTCQDGVWVCQPCGQSLRAADTTYTRGWAWRTRYSVCGGFGAGLGEGNEGVECGRDADCLAAKEMFHEIECDADDIAALQAEMAKAEIDGHSWQGSSYATQEIVGIGGQVKKKIKKRVLVGAVVKEYEDERANATFLAREQTGVNRSWCSWCERVVVGKKDLERLSMSTESFASSSSSASV